MYLILIFFLLLIFCIIILFSFPQFSPIPYYPSNMKDKNIILKGLNIQDNHTIIDLGAGDGVVIFEAAYDALKKKKNTRFVALEINPILIFILYLRRIFHPNKNNIHIIYGNMFSIDYKKYLTFEICHLTFYLYISPWLIEKALNNIRSQNLKDSRFVSYYYPIKSMKQSEKSHHGVHTLYVYE